MEDPVEVQPPGGDLRLIVLRVENSRDRISVTPPDDASLNLGHGPAITNFGKRMTRDAHRWLNSRSQLLNRLEHRLTELVHLSSVHPPVEGSTDFSTG